MAQELEVRKGEAGPRARLATRVAKNFKASLKRASALELTTTQPGISADWEIFAIGPWQTPEDLQPGRIIRVNETAYLAIVVWMNPEMCRNITQHGDKIELSIFTSDMQRMLEVTDDEMQHYCCIETVKDHCWYVYVWEFTPQEPACLYETNICARICTCSDAVLEDYAGFVRHVYDFDPDTLWPEIPASLDLPPDFPEDEWPDVPTAPPSWGFDRPVRYMVYDPDDSCDCGDPNDPNNNFCEDVISAPAEEPGP
jgi:hypothetical protein